MFIFDITNPLTLILMLIVAILLIFLSRELKKSYIAAIPLCIFLAIAVIHGAQLLTLAEEYKDLAGKLMCCIGIDFILIGRSEANNKGNLKNAILADSIEATIAAIYFDGGLDEAEKFIISNLKESIEKSTKHVGMKDHKTVLQEKLQENGEVSIKYTVIKETGPDHDKTFTVKVEVDGKELAIGEGRTKKHAEMDAAGKALEKLK